MNQYAKLAALLLVLLAGPAAALGQDAANGSAGDSAAYTIQPGDVLEVSVWKEPDLQREVLVRPDGAFDFPLIGEVQVSGKSVEDVRTEITGRLARFVPDLVVTVLVKEVDGNRIYVYGQVNKPGSFVVNPNVDVIQALSLAGGTTAFASVDDIRVLRRENGAQRAIPFKYSEVSRGRNLEQNIMLKAGDVVLVP
jgi:polysaccharide export outer membrane protein